MAASAWRPADDPSARRLDLTPAQRVSRLAIRTYGRWLARRHCRIEVAGLDRVPRGGPLLLAARHYHHLYDVPVLLATVPRPLHVLVALDWTHSRRQRWLLERACALAAWPGLLRGDRPRPTDGDVPPGRSSPVWNRSEAPAYLRRAIRESVAILAAGRTLAVFPEGAPVVDPERPTRPPDSLLPFRDGLVTIARQGSRTLGRPVPILPVGLWYEAAGGHNWRVTVRFGEPLLVDGRASRPGVVGAVEAAVRRLSRP